MTLDEFLTTFEDLVREHNPHRTFGRGEEIRVLLENDVHVCPICYVHMMLVGRDKPLPNTLFIMAGRELGLSPVDYSEIVSSADAIHGTYYTRNRLLNAVNQ